MSKQASFLDTFKKCKQDKQKLKSFITKKSNDEIVEAIIKNGNGEIGINIWMSAIEALLEDEEKLFDIIKEVILICSKSSLIFFIASLEVLT